MKERPVSVLAPSNFNENSCMTILVIQPYGMVRNQE